MVLISYSGREINAKLVYYGPGLSGKTTNLEYIYGAIPQTHRGKMVSMKTKTERTLFFDFLPIDLGELAGFKTRFLLYTVPGQVYYNATRKLVLKGVDAVVFVADSKRGKMDENIESLQNLRDNLKEQGIDLDRLPWVIQYNKRDLPDTYSVDELQRALNPNKSVPSFEAVGTTGLGVFETFKAVSRLLLKHLSQDIGVRVIAPQAGAAEAPAAVGARPGPFVAPPVVETASQPTPFAAPTSKAWPTPQGTPALGAAIPRMEAAPTPPAVPPPPRTEEVSIRRAYPAHQMDEPAMVPASQEPQPTLAQPNAPPPVPTANDVDFEQSRPAPPPGEPLRMPGMGDRLRRWLGRSRDFEEPANGPNQVYAGPPIEETVHAEESAAPPSPLETTPIGQPLPAETAGDLGEERIPEPFVEPQDDEPVPVELTPEQLRHGRTSVPIPPQDRTSTPIPHDRTPIPIPVIGRGEERPFAGSRSPSMRDGRPVVREVPVTIEIDPNDLEVGVVLKLLIRARVEKDSRDDSTGMGRARAA